MHYRALRVLATFYKIVAWIILGSGSLIAISMLFSSNIIVSGLGLPMTTGVSIATALIFEGFILVQFIFFLGLGELISIIFDIDFSTRSDLTKVSDEVKSAA